MQGRINLVELSNTFRAWQSTSKSEEEHYKYWKDIYEDQIERVLEALPYGSGLDNGVKFDWNKSKPNKLVFTFDWHYLMDGYYDGWGEFRMEIIPSFMGGREINIIGRDRDQIKDYLYDLFDTVFYVDENEYVEKRKREWEEQHVVLDQDTSNDAGGHYPDPS